MSFKVFIIAGEASGDWLGSKLIQEIRKISPEAQFYGIGGKKMRAEGFESIFPMQEISLMGFAEILPHLPNLLSRMKQTVKKIRQIKPDVLVTIDSPGFNFRIAEKLQDLRGELKMIHYVAPTVWAYKPERAAKVAGLYDHLMVILPFEPPYFEKEGLKTTFIGHPVLEEGLDKGDAERFSEKYRLQDFICMMPGSRAGELKRNLPIFRKVAEGVGKPVVIIAADSVREMLSRHVEEWKVKAVIIDNSEKADCFAACSAGVIKSGTSGLEFAFANKPYVVAYKVSPISAWILRRMIKIPYANLVNILAGKELVPELLQENFTAERVIEALQRTMVNANMLEYAENLAKLKPPVGTPSENAAHVVAKHV